MNFPWSHLQQNPPQRHRFAAVSWPGQPGHTHWWCQLCAIPFSIREGLQKLQNLLRALPLTYFSSLFKFFFFTGNFQNHSRGKSPPSQRLSMKTAVYLLNSCKDKGSPSLSAGLTSNPFFQLLPDVQVLEISLLCLKIHNCFGFCNPQQSAAGSSCMAAAFCMREGGKVGSCSQDMALTPLLCAGADAVESQWRRKQSGNSTGFVCWNSWIY